MIVFFFKYTHDHQQHVSSNTSFLPLFGVPRSDFRCFLDTGPTPFFFSQDPGALE